MVGFSDQIAAKGVYLEDLATYLEERGLTIKDIPHSTYLTVDHGYFTKGSAIAEPTPLILEGWGFQVRNSAGGLEPAWLLRAQNWPQGDEVSLLQIKRDKEGNSRLELSAPRKFKQVSPPGHEFIHWTSTMDELVHSPTIMIHEKFTSAALAVKLLGVPSIALSGCWNWSRGAGTPKDGIVELFTKLSRKTRVVVCFDGDLLQNPMIMAAASAFKGWINAYRPDLDVVFPAVPENHRGAGWDDWVVAQGAEAESRWLAILQDEGVDITHLLPPEFLMAAFGVSLCPRGKDHVMVEQTAENFSRLLNHPVWQPYVADSLSGGLQMFNRDDANDNLGFDDFCIKYMMWLERHVYRGTGKGVSKEKVKDAVRMTMADRVVSMPIHLLERQPEVTHEQAVQAATRLVTDGLRVIGPMSFDETVETILRIMRDTVALWSDDITVDPQWVLALVGPSGCGKSNFPKSLLSCFNAWGYWPKVSQFMKEGPRATMEELLRVSRDSMFGVFDEYNPDERCARTVEQNLFTLSTTRLSDQRKLHQEQGSRLIRHSAIMLTTTDKNKSYIRSGKDTGERRFITLEVQGVKLYSGSLTSDRAVIAECGQVLLRYGLQLWQQGYPGDATEVSRRHTSQYLGSSEGFTKLAAYWARADLVGALQMFVEDQTFKSKGKSATGATNDGRVLFSWPQLLDRLAPDNAVRLTKHEKDDLKNLCLESGMVAIGKARVMVKGTVVMKDMAFEITDPATWVETIAGAL
jgi:hypothetical protein